MARGHVRTASAVALLFVLLVSLAGCRGPVIVRASDKTEVPSPELLAEIKKADFIFVGEVHTKMLHHRAQLELIKGLKKSGADMAIGIEMFLNDSQEVLDRWVRGEMDEEEFKAAYKKNWTVPWEQYKDIFLFARENSIPLVGLNISKKIMYQVLTKGFESLTPEQLAELPPGIECSVDKVYEKFIREAFGGHETEGMTFQSFCEAQMVWDNGMAHNAIEYMDRNPGTTMVVLAGGGHSWKRGIPAQVERLSDYRSVVILPDSESMEIDSLGPEDADYIIAGQLF